MCGCTPVDATVSLINFVVLFGCKKKETMRMFIKYNLHFFEEVTLKQFPLRNLSEFLCGKEKVMKALSTVPYIL
jgi:hypothetical protein